MHSVAPAGSCPPPRNFNGCFAAVNLKDSISGLCPLRPDDQSMLNDRYRGGIIFRRLSARVRFTLETGRSQSADPKNMDARLMACLPKTSVTLA